MAAARGRGRAGAAVVGDLVHVGEGVALEAPEAQLAVVVVERLQVLVDVHRLADGDAFSATAQPPYSLLNIWRDAATESP